MEQADKLIIDVDRLSEAELRDLNRRIVERLHFLHQMKTYDAMLQFRVGDRVAFDDRDGEAVFGTLIRHNRKSVTVHGDDGRHWNVSPGLLRKAEMPGGAKAPNLIDFPKK
jgi:hypothetical protein